MANVLLVVGVITLATGRPGTPTAAATTPATTTRPSPTITPSPTATSSTTTSTSAATRPVSELLGAAGDVTVSVLGDGTGDEVGEWVSSFAQQLGGTHRVSLRGLDPNDPTRYVVTEQFGTAGPKVTVWNGSRRDASAAYPAERLRFLAPEKPDVVLLSFGRDNTVADVTSELESTYLALRSRWPDVPVAVVLQPQDRDDRSGPVRALVRDWAASHELPQIDVAAAFTKAGDPNSFVSTVDPPSVNARGGALWGRTVLVALGGSAP